LGAFLIINIHRLPELNLYDYLKPWQRKGIRFREDISGKEDLGIKIWRDIPKPDV